MIESQILEFKREINDDFVKEIVAFLNTNDGVIYVGIEDDGNVIGINNINDELERISNIIDDNIEPTAIMNTKLSIEEINNKKVIKIEIKEGKYKPYFKKKNGLKDGVYLRNGSTSRKLSYDAIKEMIRQSEEYSYEEKVSKYQNLSFKMTSVYFQNHNIEFENNNKRTLGIIDNNYYTNLGYMLSEEFNIPSKIIIYNSKDGENIIRRNEFNGSLIFQTESIMNFINANNKIKTSFVDGIRLDIPDYPEKALRETILNAIIHTNYESASGVTIKIYEDRLEIISVGGLFKNIKKEDIFNGISILRNKKLADIFFKLGYIERYGTGIGKILNSYKNLKQPEFIIEDNLFKVILYNQNYYSFSKENKSIIKYDVTFNELIDDTINDLEKARIAFYKNDLNFDNFNFSKLENIPIEQIEYINLNGVNSSDDCTINYTINCTLNEEQKILNLIKNKENITQQEISDKLNISLRKTKYIFKKLLNENKIIRNGSNKKGKWIVND